ncbi:MAG TPA: ferritin-like domain-containing protein [Clostridia bacterium]|nr:ferritin-like domain-containing protein [Clostridia bacterium]
MATFVKDVEEIRQRAMQKIEEGAVTNSYQLNRDEVVGILNEALATEIVCVLRYMHHYFMSTGVHARAVAEIFKQHADAEREHVDEIGERIQQLGGKPDFNPGSLVGRSVSQYAEGETLADMLREDLIAERMVIDVYQRMIEYFGSKDPTTRTLIEHIKAEEEEHASELADMMFIVDPRSGADRGQDPGTDPLEHGRESTGDDRARQQQPQRQPVQPPAVSTPSAAQMSRPPASEENSAWGNEANIGQAGGSRPPRSIEQNRPPRGTWGNEQNVGKQQGAGRETRGSGDNRSRQDNERRAHVEEATAGMPKKKTPTGPENTNITNRPQEEHVTPKAERGNDVSGKSKNMARSGAGNLANALGRSAADRDTRRDAQQSTRGEMRPARDRGVSKRYNETGLGLRGESEPPPSNIGGVGGRTMNRRAGRAQDDISVDEVAERPNPGASTGTNRTPKILQKNRKTKRAA